MLPGVTHLKDRLLVATPVLDDPNFTRTVIYMVEHHGDGALGLILNRPSPETLEEPLDRWIDVQSAPRQVFSGGPVEPDALIALANTVPSAVTGSGTSLAPLTPTIASADLAADPALVPGIDALRVFRGYAGWAPGQLEAEIESGSWLVLDGTTADIFTQQPDELWRSVLRRQPGRLGWLADAPDDLSWN